MGITSNVLLGLLLAMAVETVGATVNHISGRIVSMSFVADEIYIKVDTGLPDNCVGTPFGWMVIPASAKPLAEEVHIDLWHRMPQSICR